MVLKSTSTLITVAIALWFTSASATAIGFGDQAETDTVSNQFRDTSQELVTIAALDSRDEGSPYTVAFYTGHQQNAEDPVLLAPFENQGNRLPESEDGQSVVPFSATLWLFGAALIGFVGVSRRTRV